MSRIRTTRLYCGTFSAAVATLAMTLAMTLATLAGFGMCGHASAQTQPSTGATPPRVTPSLDADLLRDLPPTKPKPAGGGPGPSDPTRSGAPTIEKPAVTGKPPATEKPAAEKPTIEKTPATGPPPSSEEGEDIDLNTPAARVRRIHERMAAARDRLSQRDTSVATQQLQDQVLSDLDAFLEQLQKSSSQSPPSAGSSAAGKQASPNAPGPRQSRPRPKDSSLEGGATGQSGAGETDQRPVVKDVWGQWPARLREQLQNSMPEKFLPAYESLIEAYYRRLAEEPSR